MAKPDVWQDLLFFERAPAQRTAGMRCKGAAARCETLQRFGSVLPKKAALWLQLLTLNRSFFV